MKVVVRKVLPASIVSKLIVTKRQLKQAIMRLLSSRRWLANFWYGMLKQQFSREIFATKQGQLKHVSLNIKQRPNHARLRRNTHRLEKGLLMRPRRERFAQAYLPELLADYTAQIKFENACSEELQWAHNVLTEYFSVVKDDENIKTCRAQFDSAQHRFDELKSFKPYTRAQASEDIPDIQQLYNLCHRRRSVRWYKQTPVPRELIEQAISIATLAPSACNRQPFDVYVIDDKPLLAEAVELPMGTKGWSHNIPLLLVIVGDFSSFEHERDRHVPYIDASLAAMSLMLALETLGLGSCPINWPDIEVREKKMEHLLNLSAWQRPIMCLSVGYPDKEGLIAFSQKRSPKQIIKYPEQFRENVN